MSKYHSYASLKEPRKASSYITEDLLHVCLSVISQQSSPHGTLSTVQCEYETKTT